MSTAEEQFRGREIRFGRLKFRCQGGGNKKCAAVQVKGWSRVLRGQKDKVLGRRVVRALNAAGEMP